MGACLSGASGPHHSHTSAAVGSVAPQQQQHTLDDSGLPDADRNRSTPQQQLSLGSLKTREPDGPHQLVDSIFLQDSELRTMNNQTSRVASSKASSKGSQASSPRSTRTSALMNAAAHQQQPISPRRELETIEDVSSRPSRDTGAAGPSGALGPVVARQLELLAVDGRRAHTVPAP
jgi:hypothetical protein